MNYFQFFPYTFYLPFILSDIICFDKEKKLTKFDKKSLFLFIKKLKPAIKEAKKRYHPAEEWYLAENVTVYMFTATVNLPEEFVFYLIIIIAGFSAVTLPPLLCQSIIDVIFNLFIRN